MDQRTARALAKIMMANSNKTYIATTNYALRGEFDEADAVWGVINAGYPGALIETIPAEYAKPVSAVVGPAPGTQVPVPLMRTGLRYRINYSRFDGTGDLWSCLVFSGHEAEGPSFLYTPGRITIPDETIFGVFVAAESDKDYIDSNKQL